MKQGIAYWMLILTAPLWLPLRLLIDAAGLCADGLLTVVTRLGLRPGAPPTHLVRFLLGFPALLLFPLWVTIETLVQGFLWLADNGRRIVGATLLLAVPALFFTYREPAAASEMPLGPEFLANLAVVAAALVVALLTEWARSITSLLKGRDGSRWLRAASMVLVDLPRLTAGFLATLIAPVWIVVLGFVWLFRRIFLPLLAQPLLAGLNAKSAPARMISLTLGFGLLLALAIATVAVLIGPLDMAGLPGKEDAEQSVGWFASLFASLFGEIRGPAAAKVPWFVALLLAFGAFPALIFALGGRLRSGTRYESFVALRYLRGKRDGSFVSAITIISIIGVTLGVCSLNVVLGVMSGFETDLREKILGTTSHILVHNYEGAFTDYDQAVAQIETVDGVTGATPFVYTELMLKSSAAVTGAVLKGVQASTVGNATDLPTMISVGPNGPIKEDPVQGQEVLDNLDQPEPYDPSRHLREEDASLPGIILGSELADTLRVDIGHRVFLVSPKAEAGPLGTMNALVKPFRVAGIFYSGMYEYDAKSSYISLATAQEFLDLKDRTGAIEVRVRDIYNAAEIGRQIRKTLKYPFWTRDWMSLNASLFSALKLEKLAMGIILTFIIVVAALNIISALIMVVLEKSREIAIFKAMGATPLKIMKIFMIEGLIIGFIGTTTGTGLGWVICWALDTYRFIPLKTDVYYLDSLPVEISMVTFAVVALVAVGISFAATLFPSWQAAELDPVEGLRYE